MVLVLSIASLALAAISAVSGRVVPRKSTPPGYCKDLEPYDDFHLRYLNFDCQAHHGTQYFDLCCHPRKANETSVPFPSQCGCDDDEDDTSSSYSTQMTPTPTDVTPTPSESPQPEQPSEPSSSTPAPSPTPESPQPEQPSEPSSSTSSTPVPSPTPESQPEQPSEPSSSTPAPSPTPSPVTYTSNTSQGSGDVHTGGQATFFYQNGVAGACGQVHSDSDFICAMDQDLFGTSGPSSPLCGKQVTITNTANGKTVTVTVADDCPTCSGSNSIDLSLGAFQQLGSMSDGVLSISWVYN